MGTLKGTALIATFIGVLTFFAEATPMKIGVVAFTTTLMLAGASHAAEKIALICSDAKGKDDYSLSIDLDRKLASFHMSDLPDADDVPVTRVTENYIWFQNKALSGIYSQGKLDRITGSFHFFHRHLNNAKDYYLTCKPAKPFDGPAL
jgi:hypothetical protein